MSYKFQLGLAIMGGALVQQGNSELSGGIVFMRTSAGTSHTASSSDYVLGVTSVPTEILFDATSFTEGQALLIKDESGAASATDTILLNASGSQTIDGEASISIDSPYASVLLYSDGSNWFIY